MIDKDFLNLLVEWRTTPRLKRPVMLAGFFGWSNAGCVSSDTLEYLHAVLQPEVFASMSNEAFSNYTIDRPKARIEDGVILEMEVLDTNFSFHKNPSGKHDLVLFLGREPAYSWQSYSDMIIGVMQQLGVERFYTLGGVQDAVSHLSPPMVSVVAATSFMVSELCEAHKSITPAAYSGPISIHSYLLRACSEAGIEAASLWGHAPAYLQKNPRVVARLVGIINSLIGLNVPTGLLDHQAIELDRKINEAVAKDPNLRKLVEAVECEEEPCTPRSSHDKVIRLEDFVRRDTHRDDEED